MVVKVQGFGRRREDVSHEECVRHHRQVHSKLGMGLGQMEKYILYYVQEAISGDGTPLQDLPFDIAALEWWIDEKYFANLFTWLNSAPEGETLKNDEASFLDRRRCYMCVYDENIIVQNASRPSDVNLLRLIKTKEGVTRAEAMEHHRKHIAPVIAKVMGSSLTSYVANYITQPNSLEGPIDISPADIVELYKIDCSHMDGFPKISDVFNSSEMVKSASDITESSLTTILLGEEVRYIG